MVKQTRVKNYTKKDGTKVKSHLRNIIPIRDALDLQEISKLEFEIREYGNDIEILENKREDLLKELKDNYNKYSADVLLDLEDNIDQIEDTLLFNNMVIDEKRKKLLNLIKKYK